MEDMHNNRTEEFAITTEDQLEEAVDTDIFIDAHANVKTDLDAILSGSVGESCNKASEESDNLKESYRRIVSRGNILVNNDLFVDFE